MKKFIYTIIALLGILMPNTAWAQEPYAVLSDDHTVLTFYYDDQKAANNGMDVGPFDNDAYPPVRPTWYDQREEITSVVFDSSFSNCTTITSTAWWFYLCKNIVDVTGISNLKTDNVTNMRGMFYNCSSLTNIDVSGFKTDNVTDMNGMFAGCSKITSIDLSEHNLEKVTDMGGMFSGCTKLVSVNLTNAKRCRANMSDIFYVCSSLESIDLSGFGTQNMTTMDGMFRGCENLTSINLSEFQADGVTSMSYLFYNLTKVESIDLSNFKADDLTSIEQCFYNNSSLTNLNLSGFSPDKVTNISSMFYACSSITEIDLSGFSTDNVTTIQGLFAGCTNLQKINFQGFKTDNVLYMQGLFSNCSSLTSIDLSGFNTENVISMSEMFYGCSSLTSIDLTKFNTENATEMSSMFRSCTSLTSLDLSSFNTSKVTDMISMFEGCSALKTIFVDSGWSTESIRDYNGNSMFYNCTSLIGGLGTKYDSNNTKYTYAHIDKEDDPGYFTAAGSEPYVEPAVTEAYAVLEVSTAEDYSINDAWITLYYDDLKTTRKGTVVDLDKMTESPEIMQTRQVLHSVIIDPSFADARPTSTYYWFGNCFALKTISGLEYLNTSEVTTMECMFMDCPELTELDLSHFETSKVTSMNNMFYGFSGTTLDLSTFDTSNVTDMSFMFGRCENLTTIYVSDKWTTANVTSGDAMFAECTKLVGGNGTKYDENHTDPLYARIDTERAPGYFTDIADKGKEKMEQVATPTWAFQNELLALSTETADASIYYATANWADEAETDSIANTIDVSTRSTLYQAPLEITDNIIIKMIAAKEGMEDSEVATFVYDYKSWKELYDVIRYGVDVLEKAKDNANVEEGLLEELRWALNEGDMMYQRRAEMSNSEAKYFTDAIVNLCKKIEDQMNAASGELEAYACQNGEDGSMLTFFYNDARNVNGGYLVDRFLADSLVTWREIKDQIRYVTFDSSFANFRPNSTAHWFEEFSNLENVTGLENLNCSEVNDMEAMFAGCKKLTTLAGIETLNTSNVMNMYRMFTECSSLEILDVSHFDTSSSIITCNMFSYCSSLENLDVSGFNTSKVVDFSHMFAGCTNLKSIDVSHFNTSSGVHMGSIFAQCSSLTSIDLSNFNTAKAEGMSMLFQDCIGLTDIDVSHLNTSNVIAIDRMFEGCTGLTTLDLSNFDTGKVTDIFQMFKDCPNLKTIYVSSKWTTDSIKVGYQVFSNCQSIVGGAGTQFDPEHTDYDYAHVDGGSANPGYFTDKNAPLVTAKYENHILTVEGDVSMAQALEQVGGRNVVAKDIAAIVWNSSEAITRSDIEGFGNPNMLIYVQTDSIAPEGVNNVVIDGKAKSIILVDADSTTNNNFYAPMAFTAESIQYTREFKQTTEKDVSRGWEGICLPFTVQKFTHESHGEIAPFGNDASIFHFWLHQMTDKGMTNATTIEANKPYIISMPNNVSYPEAYNQAGKVTFSAENATVPVSDNTAIWSADGTIGMMSTYLRIEPSEHFYALNVGNAMEGYAEGSVFVQNLRDVKPFEVYTFHEPSRNEGAGARFISVSSLFGGEGTTGIIDIMKAIEPNGETWYDMNGRRLQSKPSRKGVYIKNGKKVVVK